MVLHNDILHKVPKEALKVVYKGGHVVNFGNELTPTQVKEPPLVEWPVEDNCYYTLCMVDPDAPSRQTPKFREWHHWLVVNIPGNNVSKGEVLSEYIGSGPPKGTGLHRYVLLAYKQPGRLDFKEPKLPNTCGLKRGRFCVRKFAIKYHLGDPVACNFFQAQWDNYCIVIHKQLTGK